MRHFVRQMLTETCALWIDTNGHHVEMRSSHIIAECLIVNDASRDGISLTEQSLRNEKKTYEFALKRSPCRPFDYRPKINSAQGQPL